MQMKEVYLHKMKLVKREQPSREIREQNAKHNQGYRPEPRARKLFKP